MTILTMYSLFLPYLGGGAGKILCQLYSPPPIYLHGVGLGVWLAGPPLSFVLASAQVGAGGKGQPLQMTTLYLS
jgi:hypothetical protein